MKTNDIHAYPHGIEHLHEPNTAGMTLRDYFAAKAMNRLIGSWSDNSRHIKVGQTLADFVSEQAYAYADAMLKARGQA